MCSSDLPALAELVRPGYADASPESSWEKTTEVAGTRLDSDQGVPRPHPVRRGLRPPLRPIAADNYASSAEPVAIHPRIARGTPFERALPRLCPLRGIPQKGVVV